MLALLFTQFANAAYACPKAAEAPAAMPCAHMMADGAAASMDMDMDQPGLCLQHCQPASQNVDPGHAPSLSMPAIVTMLVVHALHEPALAAAQHGGSTSPSAQAPPPALSILHCCLRI